jgi:integrase
MADGKLSAAKAKAMTKPGMYGDGNGLWLKVKPTKQGVSKAWIMRFGLKGKIRYMGLGPYPLVSSADARKRRDECRRLLLDGIDPIEAREARRAEAKQAALPVLTFRQAAEVFLGIKGVEWTPRHSEDWAASLGADVYQVLGDMPVKDIRTADVLKVLEPIWRKKTATASRVRGRIEAILDFAKSRGYRSGENPATWRGHLANLLPKRSRLQRVEHFAALPHAEVAGFMAQLRREQGIAARALELTILTACRSGEVLRARWGEINAAAKIWTIPSARTKSGRDHRVPLSAAAMRVIQQLRDPDITPRDASHVDIVFPGWKRGRPINVNSMLNIRAKLGRTDFTVHGFRSAFRQWAAEQGYPRDVAEMALGHVIESQTEAAYQRSDLLERRRPMMEAWAEYCSRGEGD